MGGKISLAMRLRIVELKAEYPLLSLGEISRICYALFGKEPSKHTVKRIIEEGPTPLLPPRRYTTYHQMPPGKERRSGVNPYLGSSLLLVQQVGTWSTKQGMKQTSKLPMNLLPESPGLRLTDTYIDAEEVSLTLASTLLPMACPACDQETSRLHSHYRRTVADLPWGVAPQ
ncbi:hypothetical protein BH20ACT11_BH20ACT11_00580 [soil metagenome]|jgi:hypothetical protein